MSAAKSDLIAIRNVVVVCPNHSVQTVPTIIVVKSLYLKTHVPVCVCACMSAHTLSQKLSFTENYAHARLVYPFAYVLMRK